MDLKKYEFSKLKKLSNWDLVSFYFISPKKNKYLCEIKRRFRTFDDMVRLSNIVYDIDVDDDQKSSFWYNFFHDEVL